jgi:hypothetical protein
VSPQTIPMFEVGPEAPGPTAEPPADPRHAFARAARAVLSSVASGGDEGLALLRLAAAFDEGSAAMIEAHAMSPRSQQERGRG